MCVVKDESAEKKLSYCRCRKLPVLSLVALLLIWSQPSLRESYLPSGSVHQEQTQAKVADNLSQVL